jgi:outer membrane protein assembly factor BamA
MARCAPARLRLLLIGVLASGATPALAAQLIRPGPEGFSVRSLSAWQGRTVSAIELEGNNVTREGVIRREIHTRVGEPLDLATLDEDVVRLENIAVFSDIRVEAEDAGQDGVRLRFVLKESPSWLPLVAFTYTEENGFSVGPGLSALNLFGQGIKLSGRAYFGGTTQYWANFNWPWMWGHNHNSLALLAARRERADELRGFQETSDELTPKLGRYLGDHGRAALSLSWFRMRSDVPGITLSEANEDTLHRVGLSLGWDTRDSWRDPRHGWQNEIELWRTGGALGGDGDFWSMNLDLRRWVPTAPKQKLLLAGLVSLQSGRYGEDVPVYLDYRLGGANSVRGYAVDTGKDLYGKNQLLATAEYSFTLLPLRRWDITFLSFSIGAELTLFGDVGVVWNEPEQLGWRRTRAGLGAGLRLLVPGSEMTRLDIGWSPSGGFQFHFGPWSKPAGQRFRLR